ncbi:MAG: FAD binding domain-containing protein [Anaerolineae bacterium]|nr:FAD binding domain-containing protein [Anaerolineae bacterium]
MILEYHRPDTLPQALELLSRPEPRTLPLGGGTVLNAPSDEDFAVVDLQKLGLDTLASKGNTLNIGAALTLQALLNSQDLPDALGRVIRHEAGYNLRQTATVAGTLVAADGRSPFAAAMLALDAQLTLLPEDEITGLGELLPLRAERLPGRLITQVSVPLQTTLAYEYVARSPADLPIVCVAAARWPSGRRRVVLGGYGTAPLVVLDGKGDEDVLPAVESAYMNAADEWASAEYRADAAVTLAGRALLAITAG